MRMLRTIVPLALSAVLVLAACGDDDDDSDSASGGDTTAAGGGEAATTAAGSGPAFLTFTASSNATCDDEGNAEVEMAYTTRDVVDISISIDGGAFAETAGYGPNETAVVADIPCTVGVAQEGSLRLRGCNQDGECAESETVTVEFEG